DRDVDVGGHLLDALLPVGAPDDRAHLPADDPGDVGDRLARADLREVAVDDHRVAAELGDPGGEGELGAQRRLVEDDRHGLRTGERLDEVTLGLEPRGEVEDALLLLRVQVVVREEVSGHGCSCAACSRMPGRAPTNPASCSVVMVSGGARRSVSGATGLRMYPSRRATTATSRAIGRARTTARSSPAPRTPATSGWARSVTPRASSRPATSACSTRPSRSMVASTVSAALQASGLPPKVVPCCPAVSSPVSSSPKVTSAPIGTPPPSPLATVIASGTTPSCWWANQAPVRPMPVWISSRTSSAPASRVISRAAARYPGGVGTMPASPWIGSRRTIAVPSSTAARNASTSPAGTWVTSGSSGSKGAR